jgi:foldase protein PrsA
VTLPACGDLLEVAAATVDDRKIEEDEYQRQLDFALADPRLVETGVAGEEEQERRATFSREFLTFLIHLEVVRSFARERGIEPDEAQVEQAVEEQIAQLGGEQAFEEILGQSGATRSDVETLLRGVVLRDQVVGVVVDEELTDETLRQTYEERIGEFTEVTVSHILVGSEEQAEEIARRATRRNFARLARRFSQDTGSAENGGDLGPQRVSDLTGPFGQAALDTPVGEIAGPVQTEFGFHVVLVEDRESQPFEEVRQFLVQEVTGEVYTDWLLEQVRLAEIRVNPRYGAFDEERAQVIPRRSTTPEPPVQVTP